jgi:hypothetical protein
MGKCYPRGAGKYLFRGERVAGWRIAELTGLRRREALDRAKRCGSDDVTEVIEAFVARRRAYCAQMAEWKAAKERDTRLAAAMGLQPATLRHRRLRLRRARAARAA